MLKKALFTLLLFSFFSSLSQQKVVIGSVKRGYILISELSFIKVDSLNKYTWKFTDAHSGLLKSIEITGTEKDIMNLYLFLKSKCFESNGATDEVNLSGIKISASTQKILGLKNVRITFNEIYEIGLNQNEMEKLFRGLSLNK